MADEEYEDDFEDAEEDGPRDDKSDGSISDDSLNLSKTEPLSADLHERVIALLRSEDDFDALQHLVERDGLLEGALDYALPLGELSPLEKAVQNSNVAAVSLLLRLRLTEVDRIAGLKCTSLAYACSADDRSLGLVRMLLEAGANPNARIDGLPTGMTCLHCAIGNADLKLVQLLLEFRADTTLLWEGMNAMTMAVDLQQCEIANAIQGAEGHGAPDGMTEWVMHFNDIELAESLGSGGFGQVFRATIKSTGQCVAVKRCLCQDSSVLAGFQKEARMLSSFRHEQIVLFIGACFELPNLCIVTELMPGGNLYSMLHSSASIGWQRRLEWARDVARGMQYLHGLTPPVIHRDLKTPNILLNDRFAVKLCDFGMSRTKQHTAIHTKEGGGSPLWMAPECLMGESFTEKADVYSYGVVLWEILTRQVPWEDKALAQLVGLVGFGKATLPLPADIPSSCPAEYLTAMGSCWHAEPAKRPQFGTLVPQFEAMVSD